MKIIRNKCVNGYLHYWVRNSSECVEMEVSRPGYETEVDGYAWDREILLECARCEGKIYVESVIRAYYGVSGPGDWGT